ncbi:hypothetical protein SCALM49S_05749 [Streptomyces californicus]
MTARSFALRVCGAPMGRTALRSIPLRVGADELAYGEGGLSGSARPGPGHPGLRASIREAGGVREEGPLLLDPPVQCGPYPGVAGRHGIAGALMLTPCGSVHTFGMRFAIDVAYLDRRFRVLAVTTMRPGRLGLPRLRARHVLEAEAGAMERWGVRRGVRVELTPAQAPAAGTPEATGAAEAAGTPKAAGAAEAAGAPGASGAAGASGRTRSAGDHRGVRGVRDLWGRVGARALRAPGPRRSSGAAGARGCAVAGSPVAVTVAAGAVLREGPGAYGGPAPRRVQAP